MFDTNTLLNNLNKVYNINDRLTDLVKLDVYYKEIDYVLSDTLGLQAHAKELIPMTCQDTEESYKTKVSLAVFEPYYQEVTGNLFTQIITSELDITENQQIAGRPELSKLFINRSLEKTINDVLFYSRYGYTLAIIEPSDKVEQNKIILINPKNVMGFKPFNVKDTRDLTQLRYQVYVESDYSDGSINNNVSKEIRTLDLTARNTIRFRKYRSSVGTDQFTAGQEPYYDQTFTVQNDSDLGLPVFYFSLEDYNIDRSMLLRKPPFMEVVSLNLEHYLVKAGLNYILFLATYFKEYLFGVGSDELRRGLGGGNISEVIGITDPQGKSQWSQIDIKDLYDVFSSRLKEIKEAINFFAFSDTSKATTPSTVESAASKVQDTELSSGTALQHLKSLETFFDDLINYYISMDVLNFPYTEFCDFKPRLPMVVNPQAAIQGNITPSVEPPSIRP